MRTKYLTIVLICLLLACCSKKKESESYGVSICAPSASETPTESFTKEQFEIFKMANGLSIASSQSLAKQDSINGNIAFSSLLLIKDLSLGNTETEYLDALFKFCNLSQEDFERIKENLLLLEESFVQTDSCCVFESQIDTSDRSVSVHTQRFFLPIRYSEPLRPHKEDFFVSDEEKLQRNFYSLFGKFKCAFREGETAVSIPLGNGSYSLLFILPSQNDILSYAGDFTESQYGEISEALADTEANVIVPSFEKFSSQCSFALAKLPLDTLLSSRREQKVNFELKILQPTQEILQTLGNALEEKIIQHSAPQEQILFNRPFLFVLRDTDSRAIIFQGLYLR